MKRIITLIAVVLTPFLLKAQGSVGLVAHWDFNSSLNDVSGNGHNGSNFGTTAAAGVTGAPNTAIHLDGVGAHVDVIYSSQLDLDTFTILSYVKFHGFYAGTCQGNYIYSKGVEYSGNYYGLEVSDGIWDGSDCTNFSPTTESFQMAPSGTALPQSYWQNGGINPQLDTGVWYCVAASYDGDTAKIYLNGSLIAFMPWVDQYAGPTSDIIGIGYHPAGATGSFPYWVNGDIDDIRIYNRPLAASEIVVYCDSVSGGSTPVGTILGDTICPGSPAYLTFNGTTGTEPFILTINNGSTTYTIPGVMNGVPFVVGNPTTTTNYVVTSITSSGGSINPAPGINAFVTVLPAPTADAGTGITLCGPGSFQLNGNGGGAYLWLPSTGLSDNTVQNPLATVTTTTVYNLVVTAQNGCTDTDNVSVNVIPAGIFSVIPVVYICPDDTGQLLVTGGDTYQWIPSTYLSDPTVPNPLAWPPMDMTYQVVISSSLCTATDTETVDVIRRGYPTIIATKTNDVNCQLTFATLAASGAMVYAWLPSSTLDDADSAVTIARPDTTTTYMVTGVDQYGCTFHTEITVDVFQSDYAQIQMPTAFTPNDDGINDCWQSMVPGGITDFQLIIYDRWGNELFRTDNPVDCWDGTFNGEIQPIGTYVYVYKGVSSLCGNVKGSGNFHLLR